MAAYFGLLRPYFGLLRSYFGLLRPGSPRVLHERLPRSQQNEVPNFIPPSGSSRPARERLAVRPMRLSPAHQGKQNPAPAHVPFLGRLLGLFGFSMSRCLAP